MKRYMKNRMLSILLAAVLTAGTVSPTVLAVSGSASAGTMEQEEKEAAEEVFTNETVEDAGDAGKELQVPAEESEESSASEEGSEEESSASEEGSEEESSASEEGNGEESPVPEEEIGEEISASEEEIGEEISASEEENGEEVSVPEEKREEETAEETPISEETVEEIRVPENGNSEENPKEPAVIDELLKSGLLKEISDPFLEDTEKDPNAEECTCGSQKGDALLHEWDCPVFQEGFLELCDCGEKSENLTDHAYDCTGILKAFAAICDDTCGAYEHPAAAHRCEVQIRLLESLCSCRNDSKDFSEHDEECGYYQYLLESVNELYGVSLTATYEPPNRKQNGTRLSDSSVKDWTLKSSSNVFSNDYWPIRFYKGISSMSLWVDSGANVKTWIRTIGNYKCMHPANDSVNTKKHFGALYSKVVYDGQQWYDMKITVVDYSNSVTSNNGTKVTARPGITFATDRIAFQTSQKVGAVRVRVEFFKTGTNTSANLNIRFQWRDIDDSQRFAFALGDGKIDGKYYFSKETTVNRSLNKEVLGMNMEILVGHWDHVEDEKSSKTRIAYELSNCSKSSEKDLHPLPPKPHVHLSMYTAFRLSFAVL